MTVAVTLGLLILTLALWAGADVWLYYRTDPRTGGTRGYEATISYLALTSARKRPIIAALVALVLGVLLGHLWWPQ